MTRGQKGQKGQNGQKGQKGNKDKKTKRQNAKKEENNKRIKGHKDNILLKQIFEVLCCILGTCTFLFFFYVY